MGGYLGEGGGNANRNIQGVFRFGIQNLLREGVVRNDSQVLDMQRSMNSSTNH